MLESLGRREEYGPLDVGVHVTCHGKPAAVWSARMTSSRRRRRWRSRAERSRRDLVLRRVTTW